jgi:hypothetical protein
MPKANKDYNLYLMNPNLVMEWHPSKNGSLRPRDVTPGSGKKVWWICEEGHEWQAAVYSRNRGSGCPQCNKNPSKNNDFSIESDTLLLKEWHPTRNGGQRPGDLLPGSRQKVWWLCSEGHEWQATINNRMKGDGCPRCGKISSQKGAKTRAGKQQALGNSVQPKRGGKLQDPVVSQMESGTDFRKNKRFKYQDTVILENQSSGQWSYARSHNISGEGMLFESESAIKAGTRIIVQFSRPPFNSAQRSYPSIVKWCKEISHDKTVPGFGIGVKFL